MYNRPFTFLLKVYFPIVAFLTLCRVYLLAISWGDISSEAISLIPETLVRGYLFDIVLLHGAFMLPTVALTILYLFNKTPSVLLRILHIYFVLVAVIAVASAFSDISYYQYYGLRLTVGIFTWIDTPFLMLGEMFSNVQYLVLIVFGTVLVYFVSRYYRYLMTTDLVNYFETGPKWKFVLQFIVFFLLLFTGLRGSLNFKEHPKEMSCSLFSKYPVLNNLTVNGLFNLIYTIPEKELKIIPIEKAQSICKSIFKGKPVQREYLFEGAVKKKNVVLIIMESMSHHQMAYYGKTKGYVPFFDSLCQQVIFYPNLYTSGIHTHNGIYSSLWGQPAVFDQKPMVEATQLMTKYYGLPQIMKENNYETFFFSPGDPKFDNMMSFVSYNGFDQFTSQEDYDEKEIINKWGVPDHVMFEQMTPKLDEAYSKKQPFFATYLTISTHSPYTIPQNCGFKPRAGTTDDREIAYEYADWSLQQFFKNAATKPWYNETVFALVADHGQIFSRTYDIPLSYHHCPFVVFDPSAKTSRIDTKIAMQVDVFPTILGYLNMPFTNTGFGINLLEETRPYAFFTADTKLGVIDSTHFYINNMNGVPQLFSHQQRALNDESSLYPQKVKEMEEYAFSQLQMSYELIKKQQVDKQK